MNAESSDQADQDALASAEAANRGLVNQPPSKPEVETFTSFLAHLTDKASKLKEVAGAHVLISSPIRADAADTNEYRVHLKKLRLNLPGRWSVIARVTTKSEPQSYTRTRTGTKGTVASAQLCDDTFRARVVGFDAYTAQIERLQVGTVYSFTGLEVRSISKTAVVTPDQLQLYFTANTTWREANGAEFADFPDIHATPVPYDSLFKFGPTFQTADIFGIMLSVGAVQTMRSVRVGATFYKQVICLGNDQGQAVQIALWGKNIACQPPSAVHHIFVITDTVVKKSDDQKFTLSSGRLTEIVDIETSNWSEALSAFRATSTFKEQQWQYLTSDSHFQTATNLKVFAVLDAASRNRKANNTYDAVVEVHGIRGAPRFYCMCPTPGCKRSLRSETCRVGNDAFKCPGCNAVTGSDQLGVGFCAQVDVGDATYRGTATLFNESVATLVGVDLPRLKKLQDENTQAYYDALRSSDNKWFLMRFGFNNDRDFIVNALRPITSTEGVTLYEEMLVKNEEGLDRTAD